MVGGTTGCDVPLTVTAVYVEVGHGLELGDISQEGLK